MEREKKDRMGFPHIRSHAKIKMDRGDIENKKKNQLSGAAKRKKKKERERAIAEAAADLERLKLGPTKLWTGLVTHHRDVFVKHVLPKLHMTARFFFSKANTESFALLEYAGIDESELRWAYRDCTSISTMEWAWNHTIWGTENEDGSVRDQTWFCAQVVYTNKIELLKWVREVKKCEWDKKTIDQAAKIGNLEMLKYCFANGCPYDEESACLNAAGKGHLDSLRFLFGKAKPSQETEQEAVHVATEHGQLHILKYFVEERKISREQISGCLLEASGYGHLDCLTYLLEEKRVLLNHWEYIAYARHYGHSECLHLLQEKGCPEPTDEQHARFLETHTGGAFRQ
jgi:hypothetical protein